MITSDDRELTIGYSEANLCHHSGQVDVLLKNISSPRRVANRHISIDRSISCQLHEIQAVQ